MHNETTDTVLLQVADSSLQTGDLVGMIASLQLSATSVTTAMLCTGWEASGGDEPVFIVADSYGRVFPVQNLRSQPDIGALANDGVVFFTEDGGIVNLNGFQTADAGDQVTNVIAGARFCQSGCQTGCETGCEGTCEVGCQSVCQTELPGRGMPDRLSDGLRRGLSGDVPTRMPVGLPVELPSRSLPIRLRDRLRNGMPGNLSGLMPGSMRKRMSGRLRARL